MLVAEGHGRGEARLCDTEPGEGVAVRCIAKARRRFAWRRRAKAQQSGALHGPAVLGKGMAMWGSATPGLAKQRRSRELHGHTWPGKGSAWLGDARQKRCH